jgi:hypothetical protein
MLRSAIDVNVSSFPKESELFQSIKIEKEDVQ